MFRCRSQNIPNHIYVDNLALNSCKKKRIIKNVISIMILYIMGISAASRFPEEPVDDYMLSRHTLFTFADLRANMENINVSLSTQETSFSSMYNHVLMENSYLFQCSVITMWKKIIEKKQNRDDLSAYCENRTDKLFENNFISYEDSSNINKTLNINDCILCLIKIQKIFESNVQQPTMDTLTDELDHMLQPSYLKQEKKSRNSIYDMYNLITRNFALLFYDKDLRTYSKSKLIEIYNNDIFKIMIDNIDIDFDCLSDIEGLNTFEAFGLLIKLMFVLTKSDLLILSLSNEKVNNDNFQELNSDFHTIFVEIRRICILYHSDKSGDILKRNKEVQKTMKCARKNQSIQEINAVIRDGVIQNKIESIYLCHIPYNLAFIFLTFAINFYSKDTFDAKLIENILKCNPDNRTRLRTELINYLSKISKNKINIQSFNNQTVYCADKLRKCVVSLEQGFERKLVTDSSIVYFKIFSECFFFGSEPFRVGNESKLLFTDFSNCLDLIIDRYVIKNSKPASPELIASRRNIIIYIFHFLHGFVNRKLLDVAEPEQCKISFLDAIHEIVGDEYVITNVRHTLAHLVKEIVSIKEMRLMVFIFDMLSLFFVLNSSLVTNPGGMVKNLSSLRKCLIKELSDCVDTEQLVWPGVSENDVFAIKSQSVAKSRNPQKRGGYKNK